MHNPQISTAHVVTSERFGFTEYTVIKLETITDCMHYACKYQMLEEYLLLQYWVLAY